MKIINIKKVTVHILMPTTHEVIEEVELNVRLRHIISMQSFGTFGWLGIQRVKERN